MRFWLLRRSNRKAFAQLRGGIVKALRHPEENQDHARMRCAFQLSKSAILFRTKQYFNLHTQEGGLHYVRVRNYLGIVADELDVLESILNQAIDAAKEVMAV